MADRTQYWRDYYRRYRDEIIATKRVKAAMWRERNREALRLKAKLRKHKLQIRIAEARELIERTHRNRQRAAVAREAHRRDQRMGE